MAIMVLIQSTVNESRSADLFPFLEENLPNVRSFDGCLSVTVLHDAKTNDFAIYEEWKSKDHHKKYIQMITEKGVLQQLASFFTQPPSIKYFKRQEL